MNDDTGNEGPTFWDNFNSAVFDPVATLAHWDKLRALAATPLMQGTIVVPIVGYVILFSNDLQSYLALTIDSDTKFNSWRLYFLYFGFSSLAVSAVIFNVRCPSEVKHHGSAYDFVDKQRPIMRKGRLTNMAMILFLEELREDVSTPEEPKAVVDLMTGYFEWLEEVKPVSRFFVLIFYFMGLAILAVPTLNTFFLVTRAAILN